MMRVGLYKPVHVKTVRSQEIRMLLTARKFVQTKILDAENNLRGLLRNFGLKVGAVTRLQFERRIVELLEQSPHLRLIIEPLLEVRRVLREQFQHLHKAMGRLAESDETCKLLMTAPGVGPMVALSFRAGVDEPARFGRSRSVPAHFGLTPSRYQSGEIDRIEASRNAAMPGFGGSWSRPPDRDADIEAKLAAKNVGACCSPPAWHGEGDRSCGPAPGGHPASDVGRQHTVSLGGQGRLNPAKSSASLRG